MRRSKITFVTILAIICCLSGFGIAQATSVAGETKRSDTWVGTNFLSGGVDALQGYAQLNAADYYDGGSPDCVVTTGRSPDTGSETPSGLIAHDSEQAYHKILGLSQTGAAIATNFTYWIHTAQDDTTDGNTACGRTTVTTNASGNFSVNFSHTLTAAPTAVVWSGSAPATGSNIPVGNLINSKSTTGFSGRAFNQSGSAIASQQITIDYWAVRVATTSNANYWHRAGRASVTTDANGYATINHADFTAGQTVASAQVTGVTTTGSNIPVSVIAYNPDVTDTDIRIFNQSGNPIASVTVSVDYIISGPVGGSPRPWGTQDYTQLYPFDPDTVCGLGVSTPCVRQWHGEPNYEYRLDSSYSSLGNVDGVSPTTYFQNELAEWMNADVRLPQFTQTTTPGAEEMFVQAVDIGTAACATMGSSYAADTIDGLNFISYNTFTHNTNSAIIFGSYPLAFPENCNIQWVDLHELGHAWGAGHNDGTTSVMSTSVTHNTDTLWAVDINSMRALYGYSGSAYKKGLKVSDFVTLTEGLSAGSVKVKSVGRPVHVEGNQIVTPLEVSADDWVGDIPDTIWVLGGTLQDKPGEPQKQISSDTLPISSFQPGSEFVVQLRDDDSRVLEALEVDGKNVKLKKHYNAADDIDGGDPLVVDYDKLKEKAKKK